MEKKASISTSLLFYVLIVMMYKSKEILKRFNLIFNFFNREIFCGFQFSNKFYGREAAEIHLYT